MFENSSVERFHGTRSGVREQNREELEANAGNEEDRGEDRYCQADAAADSGNIPSQKLWT